MGTFWLVAVVYTTCVLPRWRAHDSRPMPLLRRFSIFAALAHFRCLECLAPDGSRRASGGPGQGTV